MITNKYKHFEMDPYKDNNEKVQSIRREKKKVVSPGFWTTIAILRRS